MTILVMLFVARSVLIAVAAAVLNFIAVAAGASARVLSGSNRQRHRNQRYLKELAADMSCLPVKTFVVSRRSKLQTKRGQEIVAQGTPAIWEVKWHPDARQEKRGIHDAKERIAIAHAIEKLQVDGPALRSPHQSAVMEDDGLGLRELRPRRGRSRWRPIYRRLEQGLFAILSVGPEAEIDKAGYDRAVRAAKQRLARLEKGQEKE